MKDLIKSCATKVKASNKPSQTLKILLVHDTIIKIRYTRLIEVKIKREKSLVYKSVHEFSLFFNFALEVQILNFLYFQTENLIKPCATKVKASDVYKKRYTSELQTLSF